MGEVFEFNQKKFFSLEDARDLLPLVRRVTTHAQKQVQNLTTQINLVQGKSKKAALEARIHAYFDAWKVKMQKLGCDPKGMWLVDFDKGDGYYCWHYPEGDIKYHHGYLDGYRGRTKIH